jgi:CubicO group peptidase (beta-lactamase class C family)
MISIAQHLDPYFLQLEDQDKFSGVVLITQGAQQLYASAYGYANRAWRIKNTLAVRCDTASITKLFTSVAVLQLIERGLLAFETPVVDFLQLADTAISPQVNLYHLLTHTSGIADDADEEADESYEAFWRDKPNYAVTETKDFLPNFAYKPANFAPGQGCRYCNCGYVLLGLAIERATGHTYREYVTQEIFDRAGMHHSAFLRMDRVNENVAEGCDPLEDAAGAIIGWKKNIYSYPPIGSPDGGAYVTAEDLDRFLRAVHASKLLSPAMTQAFFTPQVLCRTREQERLHYGYGLVFYTDLAGQVTAYQKEGINAGVSGVIRHYPDQDLNLVILSNLMDGAWDPIRKVHELLKAGLI